MAQEEAKRAEEAERKKAALAALNVKQGPKTGKIFRRLFFWYERVDNSYFQNARRVVVPNVIARRRSLLNVVSHSILITWMSINWRPRLRHFGNIYNLSKTKGRTSIVNKIEPSGMNRIGTRAGFLIRSSKIHMLKFFFRFDCEKLVDTDKYNIQTLRCRINMQQDAVGKDSAKRRRIGKLQRK